MKGIRERETDIGPLVGNPHKDNLEKHFKIGECDFLETNKKFRRGEIDANDIDSSFIYYKYVCTEYGDFKNENEDKYMKMLESLFSAVECPYPPSQELFEERLKIWWKKMAFDDDTLDEHLREIRGMGDMDVIEQGTHESAAELWVKYLVERGICSPN